MHPCTISRCLLWGVVQSVRDLGRLKDEVQGDVAMGSALEDVDVSSTNAVTREESARARKIRSDLYSSHALDRLMAQLSSCKS